MSKWWLWTSDTEKQQHAMHEHNPCQTLVPKPHLPEQDIGGVQVVVDDVGGVDPVDGLEHHAHHVPQEGMRQTCKTTKKIVTLDRASMSEALQRDAIPRACTLER